MYHHRSRRELSLLARGQGILDGGVEIECFSHDTKAFSLAGKPLIQPASTRNKKPYKAHKLSLPKTFVTRRGQMVLFTAPEDMIIGKPCSFHEKEVSQQAASHLKTTSQLLDSALDYYPGDNFHLKHQEESGHCGRDNPDQVLTQPGHFTKVYLKSLQKASEAAQSPADCLVEDIEEGHEGDLLAHCHSEVPPVSECDSGLGQSTTSRLSAQSRLSEAQPVVIPHGSEVENTGQATTASTDRDLMASLLAEQKGASKTKKSSSKTGKKKQKLSSANHDANSIKSKSKKGNSEPKSGKSKRKRGKKDTRTAKHNCLPIETENETEQQPDQSFELTAINLPQSDGVLSVEGLRRGTTGREESQKRIARAEERRREVERKRAEKRELEAQKKREMEERLRLEEELAKAQMAGADATIREDGLQSDNVSMASVESETVPETPVSDSSSRQARIKAELEHAKLSQHRWLLMSQGEKVEKELSDEMEAAQEAIRCARQAEEERRKLEELRIAEEERRQETEKQARLEEAARIKAAEIRNNSSKNPPPDNKKRLDSQLAKQRHERLFSNPASLMFSYFNYVPPPKPKKRGRGAKTKTQKAQKAQ